MPRWDSALLAVGSTIAVLLLAAAGLATVSHQPKQDAVASVEAGIDNLRLVSPSVICGAEPQGAAAFAALQERGVRTIVSVDGAPPDVKGAERFGQRYVHIPIGYDGFPDEARRMLTRVMQECERPIFVHCHHGKHRGPAGAALCAILAGELDNQGGLKLLEDAGTSPEYAGLWRDVETFAPLPPGTPLPPLVASAAPEPLVDAMLQIDDTFERLVDTAGRDQSAIPNQSRTAELAVLLQEQFHEAARLQLNGADPALSQSMRAAEGAAAELAAAARNRSAALGPLIESLRTHCHDCHRRHRNE